MVNWWVLFCVCCMIFKDFDFLLMYRGMEFFGKQIFFSCLVILMMVIFLRILSVFRFFMVVESCFLFLLMMMSCGNDFFFFSSWWQWWCMILCIDVKLFGLIIVLMLQCWQFFLLGLVFLNIMQEEIGQLFCILELLKYLMCRGRVFIFKLDCIVCRICFVDVCLCLVEVFCFCCCSMQYFRFFLDKLSSCCLLLILGMVI